MEIRTLLGTGNAAVVGLPGGFCLATALSSAVEIRLATAFAHSSGWAHLRPALSKSSGRIRLLTGLECNYTEPQVLKEWFQLKMKSSDRIEVSIANPATFFHPKVLIVKSSGPNPSFGIVGSGNLSKGGLQSNVECAVYVIAAEALERLTAWFDLQFSKGVPLTEGMIKAYLPEHEKSKKKRAALEHEEKAASAKLISIGEAVLKNWNGALKRAVAYFSSSRFGSGYESRKAAARDILACLHAPKFDFSKAEWNQFYKIYPMGKLNPLSRDRVFGKESKLKQALAALASEPETALQKVLGGRGALRIKGFGVNTVSKILASYDPTEWPVYNSRVSDVLKDLGYSPTRGADEADRYLAYRNVMKKFMNSCAELGCRPIDAWALDGFFLAESKRLDARQKLSK